MYLVSLQFFHFQDHYYLQLLELNRGLVAALSAMLCILQSTSLKCFSAFLSSPAVCSCSQCSSATFRWARNRKHGSTLALSLIWDSFHEEITEMDMSCSGISAFHHSQEGEVTITCPWCGVVDAKKATAESIEATCSSVRTSDLGCHSWNRWDSHHTTSSRGIASWHQAPSLPWPRSPSMLLHMSYNVEIQICTRLTSSSSMYRCRYSSKWMTKSLTTSVNASSLRSSSRMRR